MNKKAILYADDDIDDRELLREFLQQQDQELEIVEAANGREAILYLNSEKGLQNPPALVILDLNMPVLNGRETLAIIKSEATTDALPVVVFTTSASFHDADFCKKFGVSMISKPQSIEEFQKAVQLLLSQIPAAI